MRLRELLFNFFHFNRQERNGVFVLIIILSVLFAIKLITPVLFKPQETVQFIEIPENTNSDVEQQTEELNHEPKNNLSTTNELFVFNPNLITKEEAQELGFTAKLATTLINFRNKGGKFYKPEDLKKLYGLSPALYEKLEPYILLDSEKKIRYVDSVYTKKDKPVKEFKTIIVDINSADSSMIVAMRGVGPAFTKRILKFRNMIGGFHSVEQLKEVYGMTDSLYQFIVPQININRDDITKIPINAIDFNSLRKHFYFNFQSAQAIINFRNKHGKLTEKDIRNLGIFSEEKLNQILPYLSY